MADQVGSSEADDRTRSLIDVGSELAGAVGGTGAALVIGPFAGAALGVAISRGAKAVAGRLLAREEVRVGATLALIEEDAEQRRRRGESTRDDGFFDDRGALRSDAEDLLEGILREAAASYEERKVALLARLFSETAHDTKIEPDAAMFMIRLVRDLTYRQLVILGAFATGDPRQAQRIARARDPAALDDLGERGLLAIKVNEGLRAPGRLTQNMKWSDMESFPAKLSDEKTEVRLTPLGARLMRLIGAADTIPDSLRASWRAGVVPDRRRRQRKGRPAPHKLAAPGNARTLSTRKGTRVVWGAARGCQPALLRHSPPRRARHPRWVLNPTSS